MSELITPGELNKALAEAGKQVEYFEMEKEIHGLSLERNRLEFYRRLERFLNTLTVRSHDAVLLAEGALRELGAHAEEASHGHPEDGPRPTDSDGDGHPGDVAQPDRPGQRGGESLEVRDGPADLELARLELGDQAALGPPDVRSAGVVVPAGIRCPITASESAWPKPAWSLRSEAQWGPPTTSSTLRCRGGVDSR